MALPAGTDMHTDGDGSEIQAICNARVARTALDYACDTSHLDTARHSLFGVKGYLQSADRNIRALCYPRYVECILKPATRFVDDITLQAAALEIFLAFTEDIDGYRLMASTPGIREHLNSVGERNPHDARITRLVQLLKDALDRGTMEDGGEAAQGLEKIPTSSITSQTSFTLPSIGGGEEASIANIASLASRRHVVVSDSPTIVLEGVPPCVSGGFNSISSLPPSGTPSPAANSRPVMSRLQDLEFEAAALRLTVAAQQQALQDERNSREMLEKRLAALETAICGPAQ